MSNTLEERTRLRAANFDQMPMTASTAQARDTTITLDLIVPTFNRSNDIIRTLGSIMNAHLPAGLKVSVVIVDNNSTDDTAERVKTFAGPLPVRYLHEPKQGKSHALNTGIGGSTGDLIGLIDDDEEIDSHWFEEVLRQFAHGDIDFLGGPCYPVWEAPPPAWLGRKYYGFVGSVTEPSFECEYGPKFPGMLMGGNAVISRAALNRAGTYSCNFALMRSGTALYSGEDRDMYERLLATGARGRFSPGLIIHHHIPRERLTMRYLRKRMFAHGVSRYFMRREHGVGSNVPTILGVPRWYFSAAVFGLPLVAAQLFVGRSAASVEAELNLFELAGQVAAAMRYYRRA